MAQPIKLVKVVLASGKVVLLREMKISHTEIAAQQVAPKANGDQVLLQILMQKALVQTLLYKVGESEASEPKLLSGNEKEDLDAIFTVGEYATLLKVIGKMTGAGEMDAIPQLEFMEG